MVNLSIFVKNYLYQKIKIRKIILKFIKAVIDRISKIKYFKSCFLDFIIIKKNEQRTKHYQKNS